MNIKLFLAGLLALITTLIHVIVGGLDVASILLATFMDEEAKLVLYAVWHMASVTLGFSALIFMKSSYDYTKEIRITVKCIAFLWCTFGGIFLAVIAMKTSSGWWFKLPQWILLLPVGLLGFWGSSQNVQNKGKKP